MTRVLEHVVAVTVAVVVGAAFMFGLTTLLTLIANLLTLLRAAS